MGTILVPVDGSSQSHEALTYAATLFPDRTLTVLYVTDPVGSELATNEHAAITAWLEGQSEAADRILEEAQGLVDSEVTKATRTGTPWREIVDYAEANDVDHIVMGSHGRDGTARLLLGSVAELVVRRASVPVTVLN